MQIRPTVVAILFFAVGTALQILYMQRFEQRVAGGPRVEVLVAGQPIPRGTAIQSEMLLTRMIPQAFADEREIRATDRKVVLNQKAMVNVGTNQILAWTDVITPSDEQRALSSLVTQGHRAVPIKVAGEEFLQHVRPGNSVDVIIVYRDNDSAELLLQDVLVLARGAETAVPTERGTQAPHGSMLLTLSVVPRQAQALALAEKIGFLRVALRNDEDAREEDARVEINRKTILQSRDL